MSADGDLPARGTGNRGGTVPRRVSYPGEVRFDWDYAPGDATLQRLYDRARAEQWDPDTEIDWGVEVHFGKPLPGEPGLRLAPHPPLAPATVARIETAFAWEFQSWMVCQFLHGEQGALVAAARLAEAVGDLDAKRCFATQVVDEARHVDVFGRYVDRVLPEPYPVSTALAALLADALGSSDWDITAIGVQILIEAIALSAFRLGAVTFNDDLIRQIVLAVARDEGRHIVFGAVSVKRHLEELTSAERRHREDFVLECSRLVRERFLLDDIWERLGVSTADGRTYAMGSPVMSAYRVALFAKVVSTLRKVGLMTPAVVGGLDAIGVLSERDRARRDSARSV